MEHKSFPNKYKSTNCVCGQKIVKDEINQQHHNDAKNELFMIGGIIHQMYKTFILHYTDLPNLPNRISSNDYSFVF